MDLWQDWTPQIVGWLYEKTWWWWRWWRLSDLDAQIVTPRSRSPLDTMTISNFFEDSIQIVGTGRLSWCRLKHYRRNMAVSVVSCRTCNLFAESIGDHVTDNVQFWRLSTRPSLFRMRLTSKLQVRCSKNDARRGLDQSRTWRWSDNTLFEYPDPN